jgi:2-succinyl-6-hydroxy-2,4-cyclohexadiene-1-carboxylate synthase
MTTYLLHGFWGQPSDWQQVLTRLPLNESVHIPDLLVAGPLGPQNPLPQWADEFWKNVEDEQVQLVGYSMGARLALSALLRHPKRVRRALLLSGNPWLDPQEHATRLAWEQDWQRKFRSLPWPQLEQEWQGIEVFSGSAALPRRQGPELRELLGLALVHWSIRLHDVTPRSLRNLPTAVDWAFGALDQKYLQVAEFLRQLEVGGRIEILPEAGHRLLIEASDFVSQWIQNR